MTGTKSFAFLLFMVIYFTSAIQHRMLAPGDGLESIEIPIACLEVMKWIEQHSSGMTSSLVTEGNIDYI